LIFPKRIYFVRHGSTGADNNGRLVGATDIPLSDEGRKSVLRLRESFAGVTPEVLYSSPMIRTCQTVMVLKEHCGWANDVVFDNRLKEMSFGDWEMRTWQDIMQVDERLMRDMAGYDSFVFPGGESVKLFIHRISEMIQLFKQSREQDIVVVSHGGVIRTSICVALGLPARHYLLFNIKPACLTVLELYEEGGILNGMNL
jgi:broad specificity phosphatase PhoE